MTLTGNIVLARGPRLAVAVLLARLGMIVSGTVFLVAGFLKASDTTQLAHVLWFDGLDPLIPTLLWLVPLWEIFLGAGLILGVWRRLLVYLSLGTLIVFTGQLAFLAQSTNAPDCGCLALLAQHRSSQFSNLFGICRNIVMITALICSGRALGRS